MRICISVGHETRCIISHNKHNHSGFVPTIHQLYKQVQVFLSAFGWGIGESCYAILHKCAPLHFYVAVPVHKVYPLLSHSHLTFCILVDEKRGNV